MKPAILGLLSCLGLCAQQASLEGVTVDAVTRTPLAGVHISLVSRGVGTNLAEPDDAYGAISDAAGHYSIGNIRPATYILNPEHAGFVFTPENDTAATPTITLKPGEQNAGFQIVMTPEARITGRVIDEFGDPVQGVHVRVDSPADVTPYGLWAMSTVTDDRGEYRIAGMPGEYYVEAVVLHLQSGPPEIRTDGSSRAAYATTYYPGALAKERAKAVEVRAGQELAGIDIHVAPIRSLKISGVVTGTPAGSQASHALVTIRVSHDNDEAEDTAGTADDGTFSFTGLAPSEYRLQAKWSTGVPGAEPLVSPIAAVTVETADATVALPVTAGEDMAGTLQVDGDPPGEMLREQWTVRLIPVDPHGTPATGGQVAADGSFAVHRVIPGKFQLTVDSLPDDAYVKSVLLGGAETSGTDLDFSNGVRGASMKVIVSRQGGQITGSIANKDPRQMVSRRLFVFLAEDVKSFATWRSVVSLDSTFAIHGIRPGKYRLFAVDPVQFAGSPGYEPLKGIAARAEEIEIQPGDRIAKDLRLSGKDDASAK